MSLKILKNPCRNTIENPSILKVPGQSANIIFFVNSVQGDYECIFLFSPKSLIFSSDQSCNRSRSAGPDRLKRLDRPVFAGFYQSRKILQIHRFSSDKMLAEEVLLLFSNQKVLLCQNITFYTFCMSLLLEFL